MDARRRRIGLGLIVAAAVVARLAVIVPVWSQPLADPDGHLPLARALASGRGFVGPSGQPTAYRPPLYPLVLSPLVGLLGDHPAAAIWLLHIALGAATVLLTAMAATRLGLPSGRVLAAALIVALDPVLVGQARAVMTETLAALLVAASLTVLAGPQPRASAFWGGIICGLAALCRPSLLPGAGLISLAALICPPGAFLRRMGRTGLIMLGVVLVLTPWAARNVVQLGEPVWTTTHGGHTLALANNPYYYHDVLNGPHGAVWQGLNQQTWFEHVAVVKRGRTEPEADRILMAEGLRMLWEQPLDFARASRDRLGRFWGLAPAGAVYSKPVRLVAAAWTLPLWFALTLGLIRRRQWCWPEVAAVAFLVALTLVHALFWTDLRMRAPLVPAIALIAAGAALRSRDERRETS